jgi:peptidoglycan/LPS O-acetylase OafA/YrhL
VASVTEVPTSTSARGIGLDVLRGVAAVGVLVTHVSFVTGVVNPERIGSSVRDVLPRLDVGVWIFFVLSGLLVGRPFVRAMIWGAERPDTGRYLLRRAVRVFPLYWVVLGVTLLTDGKPLPGAGQFAADALLVHIYKPSWAIGPITQSWTLCTEISFYALMPLFALAMIRWFRRSRIDDPMQRARRLALVLVGWFVIAVVYRAGVISLTHTFDFTKPGVDVRGAYLTWLPNFLDVFGIGVGLALWLETRRVPKVLPWARISAYVIGAVALWIASTQLGLPPVFTGFDGGQTFGRHLLFLVCATCLVAPSALATAGPAPRLSRGVVRTATIVALGSYGIYLWHQWVTEHWFSWRGLADFRTPFPTTFLVVLVGASALALVTYHLVERPAQRALALLSRAREEVGPRILGIHPALDGVRGVSIAAVLASHVIFLDAGRSRFALDGGFLGVDVFLVLSGFLIGATLLREVDRTGDVRYGSFLVRRAKRLLPPLIGFVVIHAVVTAILGDSMREELLQATLALGFVSNWQLTFSHQPPFDLVHVWSLSVEGELYLLCGAIVKFSRDLVRRAPWVVVGGLVAAAAAIALWRYSQYGHGIDPVSLYERTDTRADSMLLGLAGAVVWRSRLVPEGWLRLAGLVGAMGLTVSVLVSHPPSSEKGATAAHAAARWLFEGGFSLVAVAATAVVVATTLGSGILVTAGSWRPLRWLGRISYSLYLWHLPVYLWVVRALPHGSIGLKIVLGVGLSLLAGVASYHLFEVRFMSAWRRRGTSGEIRSLQEQTLSDTPAGAANR